MVYYLFPFLFFLFTLDNYYGLAVNQKNNKEDISGAEVGGKTLEIILWEKPTW